MSALGSAAPDAPNWSQVDSPSLKLAWVLMGISCVIVVDPVTVTLALPPVYWRPLMVGKPSVWAARGEASRKGRKPSETIRANVARRRIGCSCWGEEWPARDGDPTRDRSVGKTGPCSILVSTCRSRTEQQAPRPVPWLFCRFRDHRHRPQAVAPPCELTAGATRVQPRCCAPSRGPRLTRAETTKFRLVHPLK